VVTKIFITLSTIKEKFTVKGQNVTNQPTNKLCGAGPSCEADSHT
jgi:hypothetical protein